MIDKNYILDNITLYITSIPGGGGGPFLGYLQSFYLDKVEYKNESQFPFLNCWDNVNGGGINIYNIFQESDYSLRHGMTKKDRWRNPFSDDAQEVYNELATKIIEQDHFKKTLVGNEGTFLHLHNFPYGIQKQFKHIEHILSLEADAETHGYMFDLKGLKINKKYLTKRKSNAWVQEKGKLVYKNQKLSNFKFPPKVAINYSKFFFDVNEKEIEKFFLGTLNINEFNNEKLDQICDMIRTYTKLNKELIPTYEGEY